MLVLCYHKIYDLDRDWNCIATSLDTFSKQMEYIHKTYGFASSEELVDTKNDKRVLLTFDDGFEDNYTHALPIIQAYDIPALFFIATETIHTQRETWCNELIRIILEGYEYPNVFRFFEKGEMKLFQTETVEQRVALYRYFRNIMLGLNAEERNDIFDLLKAWAVTDRYPARTTHRMMSSEQIRDLSSNENISIGCHTVTHPSLGLLTYEQQRYEILQSKNTIEEIIGKKVDQFAYPFGGINDYNNTTINILKSLNFKRAYSTTFKRKSKLESVYEIPRVCISEMSMEAFKSKVELSMNKESYYFEGTGSLLERRRRAGKFFGSIFTKFTKSVLKTAKKR